MIKIQFSRIFLKIRRKIIVQTVLFILISVNQTINSLNLRHNIQILYYWLRHSRNSRIFERLTPYSIINQHFGSDLMPKKTKKGKPKTIEIKAKHKKQSQQSQNQSQYEIQQPKKKRAKIQQTDGTTKKKKPFFNDGSWNKRQRKRYLTFVKKNSKLLSKNIHMRRRKKIHVLMSNAIISRSSFQCHSYHQKMLKRHQNIEGILSFFSKNTNTDNINQVIKSSEEDILENVESQYMQPKSLMFDSDKEMSHLLTNFRQDQKNIWQTKGNILWWDGQSI